MSDAVTGGPSTVFQGNVTSAAGRMDGAPFASAGRIVAGVVGSHPDHLRPRQSRAAAAQGVKVVRTVARSTLTP
ncbi:hypothetical protein ACNPQM_23780 [Streptomyces sp. NPDC056231]|uniref:hypothetical protein n=1 Tax=Streptomyces sp. NPDC056231 TaxID=3345755 RepID=UPI003AABD5B3